MALKDMLALADKGLEQAFNRKAFDPQKGRVSLLDNIARTRTQFAQTEPVRGRKWFQVNNSVVAFSPTHGNAGPLTINGATTLFVPSERFGDFLDAMERAVKAGEFDGELESLEKGRTVSGTANVAVPAPRAKPRPSKLASTGTAARRDDWEELSFKDKQRVSALRRYGKNPDGSVIAEVGERLNAPILAK